MDGIQHKYVQVNGLNLHVAVTGKASSPVVVMFLHGFPEIWYSWRHQMIAVATAGYRALAPDYRGYGLSDAPPVPENASYADIVSDLIAVLDYFGISKVFLVGKDFGARPAFLIPLLHPERLTGVITLGVPFTPLTPAMKFDQLPEGFYINRWMVPGRAEADFARLDAKTVVRNIYILFSKSEMPIALYEKSGFRTALKVPYRSISEEFGIADQTVRVPSLLIMGEKDYILRFPGIEDYIKGGRVRHFVPDLEIEYLPEGSHFVQEQFPDQVNKLILNFLQNHS